MSERYKVVEGSESWHCCFKATVVDTQTPHPMFANDPDWVCECYDMETAQKIADAMNAAQQPAAVNGAKETELWRCTICGRVGAVGRCCGEETREPFQPADQQPALARYQPCGCVVCTCEHETQCQGCGAHHCGTHPVGQIPEPVYQQPAPDVAGLDESPINVIYTDGCGAGRRSPADCRYGISYVTVADTVYWPLSADDAQRLRSAECGRGDFTGPANECPACPGLVEALKQILGWRELRSGQEFPIERIEDIARNALAAHSEQGGGA